MLMVRIEREVFFNLGKLLVVQVVLEGAILRQIAIVHVDGRKIAARLCGRTEFLRNQPTPAGYLVGLLDDLETEKLSLMLHF